MNEKRENRNNESELSDEEWSESSYSSYYSDSDSSIPDWDSSVDERTGQVLYIECHPFVTQNIRDEKNEKEKSFSRNQVRQSTRSKFLRLLRRRESKRYSKRNMKISDQEPHNTNKVKFQDLQEGEEREVILKIRSESFQKGNTFSIETLFGINVSTLSDGMRLMVAGFMHDSNAKYEKNIKIGDWLKSVNGIDVNCQNINSVLQQLSGPSEVLIKLQRVAGVDVTKDPPINVLNNQSSFVKLLMSQNSDENHTYQELLCSFPLGVLYLDIDKLNEIGDNQDIIYCYPKPIQKNMLVKSKGIFLTLSHLLQDITNFSPKLTSSYCQKILCHVTYTKFENTLLLLMLPEVCVKSSMIGSLTEEIVRMFQFTNDNLKQYFGNSEVRHVDHFFDLFFAKMLNNGDWPKELKQVEMSVDAMSQSSYSFEDFLPAVHSIDLPNEAMIQVDDALTELEACDYREWNEEPLDCQRIFTMLGSAWYHSGYLLASHLPHEDLVDVHLFCKHQGIIHLSKTEPVKTLIVWKEVFPSSCRNINIPMFKYPESRRYLLIVGTGKDLLIVIMEAGGSTEPPEDNAPPDPFYVEEVQATLAHLQELGIPELADRFIDMNPGPQVTIPVAPNNKKKQDMMNYSKAHGGLRDSAPKKQEVTSILKRRNNDQNQTIYTSTYSLAEDNYEGHSEDSGSQECASERSELSDDVIGRRIDRRNRYDSDAEESENDENADGSQMSNNSFDISEMKQMLLTETEDILPMQITSGHPNVLYHFVQFDKMEGILLSPAECKVESLTYNTVISNFRKCCQHIHDIFQNTIRFKEMSSQDMTKSLINKSLIAIKEYGTLFECPSLDEKESKKNKISYWVIGRLFFNPHVREIYVCYNDSIPQNVIELAFKMNMGFC